MQVGILRTDTVRPEWVPTYGEYPDMFERLLGELDPGPRLRQLARGGRGVSGERRRRRRLAHHRQQGERLRGSALDPPAPGFHP